MDTAREITARLVDLLRREHGAMADFLVALADFDAKALWRDLGHTSLFSFLRRELGLSAGAAQYRKTAAELVRRFPEIEKALRDGRLCLSSVIELAKVVTPENAAELLPRFHGLSSRDAAMVAATIRPVENPPQRDVVTLLRPAISEAVTTLKAPRAPAADTCDVAPPLFRAPELPAAEPPRVPTPAATRPAGAAKAFTVEPLDAESVRLHVTLSRHALAKLEAARDALSHARPGASMGEIVEAALDLLLDQHAKRKGLVNKPRKEPPPSDPGSRHVPAHVRRAVWIRDGGRCQFPMQDGRICGSTYQVELDHVEPWALGGKTTVENTRIACRPHNQLFARRVFGDAWMDRFAKNGKAQPADDGRSRQRCDES
jgi:hypothetical protein